VTDDESGMRVDRFLEAHFPSLSFSHIQRVIRKGELRVDGKRAQPNQRLQTGQAVRIPPLRLEAPKLRVDPGGADQQKDREFLKSITLYEDTDVLVLNKPMGLAVQGGSGTKRHLDGMLEVLRNPQGQRPRLVHRLDKDTVGCLLVAKTRLGMIVRAGSYDRTMVRALGINVTPIFSLVFGLGAALAAFAGVLAAPILSVSPGMGDKIIIIAFVVVVIGGIGSIKGAFVGALLVGLFDSFGKILFPSVSSLIIYALMAAVLIWRPHGLFGTA